MSAVFKKEFKSFFSSMVGYIVIAFILLIVGIYSTSINFIGQSPFFEYSFGSSTFVFLFVIPILTMRSFSEERRSKTDYLLSSLPISSAEIVLGKYFASVAMFAIPCLVMCFYPLVLGFFGTVNYLSTYFSIFAFFVLGSSLIALGMFVSSLTESQLISAVISFGAILLVYLFTAISSLIPSTAIASFVSLTSIILVLALILWIMTKNLIITFVSAGVLEGALVVLYVIFKDSFAGLFNGVLVSLSPFDKMYNFLMGIFDLPAIVFYISFSFIFLFLTYQSVEKRRWS